MMEEGVVNDGEIRVLFEENGVGLLGDKGVEGMEVVKGMGEGEEEG